MEKQKFRFSFGSFALGFFTALILAVLIAYSAVRTAEADVQKLQSIRQSMTPAKATYNAAEASIAAKTLEARNQVATQTKIRQELDDIEHTHTVEYRQFIQTATANAP